MITPLVLLLTLYCLHLVGSAQGLCGDNIRWSHRVDIEHVYGMWYGVGYAQHSPDMTNKPEDIGCVALYITEAEQFNDEWLDWTLPRSNYSHQRWLSYKNNPWSDTALAGSWLDTRIRFRRRVKRQDSSIIERRIRREAYGERRLKVLWDEDGQSMEQTYVYSKDDPGLWTVEKWRPMEREMMVHGVDVWYPDDPPRHPEVIRVLKITHDQLIINHCSDRGGGGIFSLILRRSPKKVGYWEWYELQKQFYNFELPNVHRKSAVCAACLHMLTAKVFIVSAVLWKFL